MRAHVSVSVGFGEAHELHGRGELRPNRRDGRLGDIG